MVWLSSLWLPIVLSAIAAHIASSILHMLIGHHAGDRGRLPQEDALLEALRAQHAAPDDYMAPHLYGAGALKDPEIAAKRREGPIVVMTLMPGGQLRMARSLTQWFIYLLVVFGLAAYVASRTLPSGAAYLAVFRVVGTVAFMGLALGYPPSSIWWQQRWSTTLKYMIDGLIYALLGAGLFGWLWPR